MARPLGSFETVYETTFLGDVDDAGDRLAHCAIESGAGENTKTLCKRWRTLDRIKRKEVFGLQGSGSISPDEGWLADQKKKLKEGNISEVIGAMEPHVEPDSVPKEAAPVRTCYNYMRNRRGQFNYKEALTRGFPSVPAQLRCAPLYYSGSFENSWGLVDT